MIKEGKHIPVGLTALTLVVKGDEDDAEVLGLDGVDVTLLDVDPATVEELVTVLEIEDKAMVEDTTTVELVVTAIGPLELIVLDSTVVEVVDGAVVGLSVIDG
jgi:hypothetical protein